MNDWPRVKELFHCALERDPAERAAFLAATCAGDSQVRDEVERLLVAHAEAGGFIEQSPVTLAGRVIGHYEIERAIGAGGMGQVYLARDLELNRPVAIKIALSADADSRARLKREAQHASQLNHPHICTIYEVGIFGQQPFIAMEYVEGRRLSDLIPPDGLPPGEVRRYGIHIADALAHAHSHGVTHRDLKTANVVVTTDGRAKVLDFGLARRLGAKELHGLSESRQSITADDIFAGTLACMAPELLRGGVADARSDIWALGVLLYEMASGTRPFRGTTGFELSAAILQGVPEPLPDRIPQSLQAVITRCLAMRADDRYQNAREIGPALEASVSTIVQPVPRRRHRMLAVGALVLALSVGAGVRWQLARDSPGQTNGRASLSRSATAAAIGIGASGRPAVAVMSFENLAGDQETEWLAKGIPRMLVTGLAQARGLDLVSAERLLEAVTQSGAESLEALEKGRASEVARRAGAGAIVVGSIAKSGNDIRIDAQLEDLASGRVLAARSVRGTDVFALVDQLASEIREGVGLPNDAGVRRVADVSTFSLDAFRLFSLGADAFANARGDDAQRALEEAVRIDPAFAEAYLQLASVAGLNGQPRQRRAYLEKAAEHADRLSERQQLLLSLQIARNAGNVQEASRTLDELISRFPDTELAYTIALRLYTIESQDVDKAVQITKGGVAALPTSSSARNAYGYALIAAGRYADAIGEFEKYTELAPREANSYDSLAEAHLISGSPQTAVELYARALAINPTFRASRIGQAWGLAVQGRLEEALAARPPLSSVEGFLLSRAGRYQEAARVLESGRQRAERDENLGERLVCTFVSSLITLERKEYARALRELPRAETAPRPADNQRFQPALLIHFLAGIAELGAGRPGAARARLQLLRKASRQDFAEERFWYHTLEGELALANGELQKAAAAFSAGEPTGRMPITWQFGSLSIPANSLLQRDGLARVAKARGDLRGAIEMYRSLLVYGPKSKFIAAFEPRYVLELARLLEETRDTKGALQEYERFLELWKQADLNLPEVGEARRAVTRLRASGTDRRPGD